MDIYTYLFFLFASQGPLDSQLENREGTKHRFLEVGMEIQELYMRWITTTVDLNVSSQTVNRLFSGDQATLNQAQNEEIQLGLRYLSHSNSHWISRDRWRLIFGGGTTFQPFGIAVISNRKPRASSTY
jgi:hypothetical protein